MAFSKELLPGLAAELVRLGISLVGVKPGSCHSGADLVQLTDKSIYWESEARACREGLRRFFCCEAFWDTCQNQLRWMWVLFVAGVVSGLCAGYILGAGLSVPPLAGQNSVSSFSPPGRV